MDESFINMNSNMQRPNTAGVHVTEHPPGKVNPSPVILDETESLIEDYLSPRKLKALTGVEDLDKVKLLEMRVDTSETSLGNFGSLLPNLSQLKLSNSIISSVRDLGSCFPVLRILWMARCNLEDLDGITAMTNLKELYAAYNDIHDLSPLSMMDQLEILDLEGNNVCDITQVDFLSLCSSLNNLTLDGNPVCTAPHPDRHTDGYDYRQTVVKSLPQLAVLDDIPTETKGSLTNSNLEFDWKFLQELENEGTISSIESSSEMEPNVASPIRPNTGYRPGTSLRPTSAMKRLTTARIIGTAAPERPKTSAQQRPLSSDSGTYVDTSTDASELTTGQLVCGNPVKSLLARRKKQTVITYMQQPDTVLSKFKHKPERSYPEMEASSFDEESTSLLEELKEWRLQHESVHKKLEESRAPNILKIDHTELSEMTDSMDAEERNDEGFHSRQEDQLSDEDPQSPSTPRQQIKTNPLKSPGIEIRRRKYKPEPVICGDSLDTRPLSGPNPVSNNFRLKESRNEKVPAMPISQPVIIRADLHSPEKVVIDRSSKTARATVFSMKQNSQLIPLPSRPTLPK